MSPNNPFSASQWNPLAMLLLAAPSLMLLALGFTADAGWLSEVHEATDPERVRDRTSIEHARR